MAEEKIICMKCNMEMKPAKANLSYLDQTISYDFLTCPKCKAIYISPELATGKLREIEMALEDK
jgi:uncharacterized protein with PIN domain